MTTTTPPALTPLEGQHPFPITVEFARQLRRRRTLVVAGLLLLVAQRGQLVAVELGERAVGDGRSRGLGHEASSSVRLVGPSRSLTVPFRSAGRDFGSRTGQLSRCPTPSPRGPGWPGP